MSRPRPTEVDERLVGLSFIEVLFAIVVARALDPLAEYPKLPGPGLSHLAVAGVLTIASWIGYHNSWNRPRYFIRFANLPLWQFVVDVALVVTYWLTALWAEGSGTELGEVTSARPEAVLVAASFVLYLAWDRIALAIRNSDLYDKRSKEKDVPPRRHVTEAFAAAAAVFGGVVFCIDPSNDGMIVAIDAALILLILGFRVAKEQFTPIDAYRRAPA